MEVAHARLSSPVRNFIVKYADDISFDYADYKPIDANPDKHGFFSVIDRGNDRMQHLALLGRLLLIERADGPTEVRDKLLAEWIDETQTKDGIGNPKFEKEPIAVALLKTLKLTYDIFRSDPAMDEENGVKELNIEYFIISFVMLVRYLRRYYAFLPEHHKHFREFTYEFHHRWKVSSEDDRDILIFSTNRQQSLANLENRDKILRQAFFEYLEKHGIEIKGLDAKRAFNEAERIRVYRKQDGLCQMCLAEGKSQDEAAVSWSAYQTDHILPWIRGGTTTEDNAEFSAEPQCCQRKTIIVVVQKGDRRSGCSAPTPSPPTATPRCPFARACGGLLDDDALRAVDHFVGYFLAAMSGQAVHEEGPVGRGPLKRHSPDRGRTRGGGVPAAPPGPCSPNVGVDRHGAPRPLRPDRS